MSAKRVVYLDSSAIVKLVVQEPESASLRSYVRRRRPLVSSALARTEVVRAVLPFGDRFVARGLDVLGRLDLVRVSDQVLASAGQLLPAELRSLDAIHLATAQQFGTELSHVITYDERMATTAVALGLRVASPV
jgi:uncharacterized protein